MNGFSKLVCNIKNYHQISFSTMPLGNLWSKYIPCLVSQPSSLRLNAWKHSKNIPRVIFLHQSLCGLFCLLSLSFFVDRYFLSAFVFCFLSSRPFLYSLLGNYSLYTNAVAEPHIVRHFALSVSLSLSHTCVCLSLFPSNKILFALYKCFHCR